jgi:hypothetical protein
LDDSTAAGSTISSRPGRSRDEITMYVTARMKTRMDVQTFSRRPRMWWASSTRMYSIQPRPAQYAAT